MTLDKKELSTKFNLLVFVAALGYFVDVYDIVLFMMVKKQSLMDIGIISKTDLFDTGIFLHNWQMIGMLVGGIFWGILGDKKGRLKVLFGSIIMYSLANVLNGFVQDVNTYAVLRFFCRSRISRRIGCWHYFGGRNNDQRISRKRNSHGSSYRRIGGGGCFFSSKAFRLENFLFCWRRNGLYIVSTSIWRLRVGDV